MTSPIRSILRAATRREGEPLNILDFPTHERYQSGLARTGHRFWAIGHKTVKSWNRDYASVPDNYVLLDPARGENQLPADVDFDLVLCQNKDSQYPIANRIRRLLHLPLLSIEHCWPHPDLSPAGLAHYRERSGDANVFISPQSRDAWGWGASEANVVHHGVDTEVFCPPEPGSQRRPYVLTAVNDFNDPQRHWCCGFPLYQQVIGKLSRVHLGSSKDGWSQPARSIDELAHYYQDSAVFLNTSTFSPVPTVLLEAMACGAVVISTDNCLIPDIIKDGQNGFLTNDPARMTSLLKEVLADPDAFDDMRQAARTTILEKFSMNRFVSEWDRLLRKTADIPYRGI